MSAGVVICKGCGQTFRIGARHDCPGPFALEQPTETRPARVSDAEIASMVPAAEGYTRGGTDGFRDRAILDLRDSRAREAEQAEEIVRLTAENDRLSRLVSTRCDEISALREKLAEAEADNLLLSTCGSAKVARELRETQAALAKSEKQRDRLSNEVDELKQVPWPKWAEDCLKIIRKCSGSTEEEVDLPEELEELLSRWDATDERCRKAEAALAEAEVECQALTAAIDCHDTGLKAQLACAKAALAETQAQAGRAHNAALELEIIVYSDGGTSMRSRCAEGATFAETLDAFKVAAGCIAAQIKERRNCPAAS